jgi:hypothetical protein
MLNLKTFTIGLLTLISLAPSAQAAPLFDRGRDSYPTPVQRPVGDRNSQPEIKVIVNPQSRPEVRPEIRYEDRYENRRGDEYRYRQEVARRRHMEMERVRQIEIAREREIRERIARERAEREARARWEASRRRHRGGHHAQPSYYPPVGGHGDYNSVYRR